MDIVQASWQTVVAQAFGLLNSLGLFSIPLAFLILSLSTGLVLWLLGGVKHFMMGEDGTEPQYEDDPFSSFEDGMSIHDFLAEDRRNRRQELFDGIGRGSGAARFDDE